MVHPHDYPWIGETSNVWMILRLSKEERGDPDALAKHRSLLLRLAKGDGFSVPPGRVVEEIESGDTIAGRPKFAAALQQWERLPYGAGGIVLSTEVARLTRGLQSDQGRVQDAMRRAHLLHRTPARWYDLRVPEDATAWELEGFAARLELRSFKWRMQLAADELLRQGRSRNGRAPFGWRWDPVGKDFVVDPFRFPLVVAWCRDIHTMSLARLAARDGVPMATIHDTLNNPAICGWPVRKSALHHGARPWKTKVHVLPREEWEWPECEGRYPQACSREEWEAIQATLHARYVRRVKTGSSAEGWCRDVVQFRGHPGPVRLSCFMGRGTKGGYLTYERVVEDGPKRYVARELVHAAARAALARACRDPAALAGGLLADREAKEAHLRENAGLVAGRRGELGSALAGARRALDEVTRLLVEAGDREERASLLRIRAEKLAAVRVLSSQLSDMGGGPSQGLAPVLSREFLAAVAAAFESVWEESGGDERRALVNACLLEIPVEVVAKPAPWAHERRVRPVVYQPWLARLMSE